MTMPSTNSMLPGWYMRADMPSRERFWNGAIWTDLERDAPALSSYLGPVEPIIQDLLAAYDDTASEHEAMSLFALRTTATHSGAVDI